MAAPTFVAEYETTWTAAAPGAKTASVTVASGDVLVIFGLTEERANLTLATPTGGGLTYTLRQENTASSYTGNYLWTATSGSSQTFTLSVTSSGSSGTWGFNCLRFSGSTGIGNSVKANATSGAPSASLTTTAANSAIVQASGDWNAVDGTTRPARTTDAGALTEQTYFRNSSACTVYGGYYADAGTAAAKTIGWSGPTGQQWVMTAVEVLGTAGGGSTPVSAADTATGTDAATVSVAVSSNDARTGTDAATLATAVSSADAGAGTDTAAVINPVGGSDTATATDAATVAVALTSADSGTATDAGTLAAAVSGTETGAGTDAASATSGTPISAADTVTAGEGATVAVSLSTTDAVTVTDAVTAATRTAADTFTGTDSATVTLPVVGKRYFTPPTTEDGMDTTSPLFRHYRLRRGVTVLVSGSTVTQVQYPGQDTLDSYDYVYLGGHVHPVTDAEVAILTAAGYGANITTEPS